MSQPRRWNLLNTLFLTGTLALALGLVPWRLVVAGLRWSEVLVFLAMTMAVGTAISGGYHRLFSHRAYRASWPVRFLFLCFGAAAFENSALKWSSDHRVHHRHVDTDGDPYSIGKGFWYAHWTWAMEAKDLPLAGVADLEKDPLVRWQHRHFFLIGAVVAALPPLIVGLATGNVLGQLVFGVLLRIVATHHTTFFINSAAHRFGSRPYTDANTARDNWFLAPLTYGEGYHNFHHLWQWDYRNGALWYQWDSTKWLLNVLAWFGLVGGFRRVSRAAMTRARLHMEEKRLRERLASASPLHDRLATARHQLETALAALHDRHEAWGRKKVEWREKGQARAEAWREGRKEWKASAATHRRELKTAWAEWKAARLEVRTALVHA
ncbi:fatty acid desaturase [Geothrix sp. 21YS21S-4]|uniref:acyl-CoA desaturase n=1 Tax=Geothrix sp. 21YS21S-4 TaxID=3068889 RepID=UPI0027B917B9|nr:fatty acid desaturase [Geothrix sp. 21YS21S-4]